jgi:flagellar hook-associated protein 3 FlgL
MRITNQMMTGNAIQYMSDNLERLNALNERASTGKQIQNISDDPGRAASIMSLKSTLQVNQNYIENDHVISDWMSATEASLKQMIDLSTRATNLTTQGVSDTNSTDQRNALAAEIDELLVNAVDIANTKHQDKYIYAGFNTKSATAPFQLDAAHTAVTPNDDTHSIQLDISPGQTITTNVIGRTTFSPFFQALIDARDALRSNNSANIQTALTGLQAAMDPLTNARTTNGARQRQVTLTTDAMTQTGTELKSLLSSKEDVNMAEAITQLTQQENTYKTVIQVSSRTLNITNLFDAM